MAVLDIDALLQPISAEAPCGPDLDDEPPMVDLKEKARGKPEQSIGDRIKPAEEPEWEEVQTAAIEVFKLTKDLRVAGFLYFALLKRQGFEGVASGLALLRGMLERHWEHVHPQLERKGKAPDFRFDATLRVNSLTAALADDNALTTLRNTVLLSSRQFGRVTLRNHRIAIGTIKLAEEEAPDTAQEQSRIDAVFADVSTEVLSSTAARLSEAAGHLKAIQEILQQKAGGVPEDTKPIATDIKELQTLVGVHLSKRGVPAGTAAEQEATPEQPQQQSSGEAGRGVIRNSTDVLAALQRICDYYKKSEPSSPVPLLLQRAARLVNKDFMEILRDLAPAGVNEAEVIGGLEKRDS